jgi:hypothetical protein
MIVFLACFDLEGYFLEGVEFHFCSSKYIRTMLVSVNEDLGFGGGHRFLVLNDGFEFVIGSGFEDYIWV